VTCTITGNPSLETRAVTVDSVTATAPDGWAIDAPAADGVVDDNTVSFAPATEIGAGESVSVSLSLTPACVASTDPAPLEIVSTLSGDARRVIAGPATTIHLTRSAGSQSVLITSSPLAWQSDRSSGELTLHGTLAYQLQNTGCEGWAVTLSADPLTSDAPGDGATIPPSNIAVSSAGVSPGDGVMAAPPGTLDRTATVLTASPGQGIGTWDQTLGLTVTVPADVASGTYATTVTVTISGGSDPE
jgi:hypothetical protein